MDIINMLLKIQIISQAMFPTAMLPNVLLFFIFTVCVLNDKWIGGYCLVNADFMSRQRVE